LMHALGLDFNLANVWGAPLIIGASAEYGLNVITRFMEARTHGGPLIARSTVLAGLGEGHPPNTGFGGPLVAHPPRHSGVGVPFTLCHATQPAPPPRLPPPV